MTARARPNLPHLREAPVYRSIHLMESSESAPPEVYVSREGVTTLRFEQPCDPSKTRLLAWEGHFEPLLVGGRSVVIVPLKDLTPGDRFLLMVTLMDGTELSFTVINSKTSWDGQVDVYADANSPETIRVLLEENQRLQDENRRHHEQGTSIDHALAALIARNEVSMTPFKELEKTLLHEDGAEILISLLMTKEKMPKRKVAMVFTVTNKDPERPWELMDARLSALATQEAKAFALREFPDSIAPGRTGRIVMVIDLSELDPKKDGDQLVFELFRNGGRQQSRVVMNYNGLLR
nr:DUF2381 family protein [Cystobacter fuscus]